MWWVWKWYYISWGIWVLYSYNPFSISSISSISPFSSFSSFSSSARNLTESDWVLLQKEIKRLQYMVNHLYITQPVDIDKDFVLISEE